MKRMIVSLMAVVQIVGFVVWAQNPSAEEWADPSVNSVNRLPPRTYSMPLKDEAAALTDALEPETPYKMSLNGTWKFSWAGNPDLRVKGFWQAGFDDSRWFDIEVPSCVELSGFGSPGYTNIRYPHADLRGKRVRDQSFPGRCLRRSSQGVHPRVGVGYACAFRGE